MLNLGNEWLTVSAPATIANVGPGFDVLGIAVKNIEDVGSNQEPTLLGDIVHIRKSKGRKPLTIREVYVNGVADPTLTKDVCENVVGVAALDVISKTGDVGSLEIILEKMPFRGSGMGSSSASVVAGAYAALIMCGSEYKQRIAETVVRCEVGKHPDNVLAALFGGVVASFGLTEDQSRMENLYNLDIINLKEALCFLKGSDSDVEGVLKELQKTNNTDIQMVLGYFEKARGNLRSNRIRGGQAEQNYIRLLDALGQKAQIYKNEVIQAAIDELKQKGRQDLLSTIALLKEKGIKEIGMDLLKAERYEKRMVEREKIDSDNAQIYQKNILIRLFEESLSKKLKEYSPQRIDLDYRKLSIPDEVYNKFYFVLIKPDISISTVEARKLINRTPALANVVANARSLTKLIACLYEGDLKEFGDAVCKDRIVEPARAPLIPGYYKVKDTALRLGAYGFNISGSGPTCFAVTDGIDKARSIANGCMKEFRQAGLRSSAYICRVDSEGARRI